MSSEETQSGIQAGTCVNVVVMRLNVADAPYYRTISGRSVADAKVFRNRKPAFSLVEILVVIGILGILLAILIPVCAHSREAGRGVVCSSNLRVIGAGMTMYTADNDGSFPPVATNRFDQKTGLAHNKGDTWQVLILPYLGGKQAKFPICPDRALAPALANESANRSYSGYCYNLNLSHATSPNARGRFSFFGKPEHPVAYPALVVEIDEGRAGIEASDLPDSYENLAQNQALFDQDKLAPIINEAPGAIRHGGGAQYLFVDGHVKWYLPTAISIATTSDGVHPGIGT